GTIGAGKSVLCRNLAQKYNLKEFTEPVETNPYLDDFYRDMKGTSFQMQLYLLLERFKQQKMIENCPGGVVQDRSMYCAKVFAKMLKEDNMIDARDYDTYMNR
ncbi:MAG: deoxynucleoside kinase, partial [Rhodospirillaceae bacterium]